MLKSKQDAMKDVGKVFGHNIEIWGKKKETNSLNQTVYTDKVIKTVWASIVPQTGRVLTAPADTILSNITHKIIMRYSAMPDIQNEMWFKYKDKRFDIEFILNPYESNTYFEIFVRQVI